MTNQTLNQRIVQWARGKLGDKVGRGECWDLAEEALTHSGGMTSNDLGPVGTDTDYIWGTSKQVRDILPGDILQFRDHVITTVTETRIDWPDGGWTTDTQTRTANRGHHTAIVNGTPDGNGRVATLDQHVRPLGEVVQNKVLYTRDVPARTTITHERRENPHDGVTAMATVRVTVTITTAGRIWAYAPRPAP